MCEILSNSAKKLTTRDKIDKFRVAKSEEIKWEYYNIFKPSINTLCDLACGLYEEPEEGSYGWAILAADRLYDKILVRLADSGDNFREIISADQSPWKKIVK